MAKSRRDFLAEVAFTGAVTSTASALAKSVGTAGPAGQPVEQQRPHGGVHSVLAQDHPYLFIDACMQMWPDADFGNAHRHGVSAYAVTAWRPNTDVDIALGELMYWHLVARQNEYLFVAHTTADLHRAKREGKATLILASQDGDWIGDKMHRIEAFYRLGLRMTLLAYSRTNQLGGGCLDRTDGGLTRLVQMVVDECN